MGKRGKKGIRDRCLTCGNVMRPTYARTDPDTGTITWTKTCPVCSVNMARQARINAEAKKHEPDVIPA